ncbi:MAG TPA: hypothetical protein VGY97_09910 [Solirubrobacteraceae bacterium]|nr:hypothetical protein [Solirubrobacteraceae bacterium]
MNPEASHSSWSLSSLLRRGLAVVILVIAGWILLSALIHIAIAIVIPVIAVVALIWALRVLVF